MTFKELIDGIESDVYQIRIRVKFELKWYVFQFVTDYLASESNWRISQKGKKLIENYVNFETGISETFSGYSYDNDKLEYKKADDDEIKKVAREYDWGDDLVGNSEPVFSTNYFSRKGVAVLSKDYALSLIEFFVGDDNDWTEYINHSWNVESDIPEEFFIDFPHFYWDEFISAWYPSDFFKEDIREEHIDEILELSEDFIDNKPVRGVCLDVYEQSFLLGIYKLKGV